LSSRGDAVDGPFCGWGLPEGTRSDSPSAFTLHPSHSPRRSSACPARRLRPARTWPPPQRTLLR